MSGRATGGSDSGSAQPADPPRLSLNDLRQLQRSLRRRVVRRDESNILTVGFGLKSMRGGHDSGDSEVADGSGLAACFLVRHKSDRVAPSRRIQPVEPVRLIDRTTGRYRTVRLRTDVIEAAEPRPVGADIHRGSRAATTAAVVRWTTLRPAPPRPQSDRPDDPRWRWGLLTVAHLFRVGGRRVAKIERTEGCGDGPATIEGDVVAAGRLPGGPDAAVLETGLDRLWLSGFLPDPAAAPLRPAGEEDLLRWLRAGTSGYLHRAGRLERWQLATYLPEHRIAGLGTLRHVVRLVTDPQSRRAQPFGPGSSGAIAVAGGVPLGMQVAAESPAYQSGYAQALLAVTPPLSKQLAATELDLVHVF